MKVSEAHKIANKGNWQAAMETAYNTKSSAMDWLGLEATLRAYIRATKDTNLDGIVACFTKRGCELVSLK